MSLADHHSAGVAGREVLICGAGIAGIVLAYRLTRGGFRVTVVERAPALRRGGNAVDLRGPAVDIVSDMGVYDELRTRATELADFYRIDPAGNRVVTMAPEVISGDIELLRTDLSAVLFAAAQGGIAYRFNDSVTSLDDAGGHVAVTFQSGTSHGFDLVIGADGLHSQTRALAFGPESEFVRHLGCYQAHFTTDNVLNLDRSGLLLNRPGRTLGCYSVERNRKIVVGLFFDSPAVPYDRTDAAAQQLWLNEAFAGMGWRTAELLDGMDHADDFYFDSVAQVVVGQPHRGRVALVGDAAHSPSLLSGMGATLAIIGAAVLADELTTTPDDHLRAFNRYHERTAEMVTLSHQLARVSRGWFIQPAAGSPSAGGVSADEQSDALRQRVLDAARAAAPAPV
ncbi:MULTISPECIES: FAD-dependent monooxygenase [unclassified Mycobacterium]|uniref:FAD-dependent monooxygenase n=1 Tax=unclassified Mycobacterium TaxID=2642494 RepID=UPI0004911D40|nr:MULTISPECIES: FAD-dependent monooxygenase [unclassified Mycobacterium]SEB18720.1 2-polyprenyl-6-methoxyphenol hydroxylase [Mycobacterium sp. 283mftsu]